MLSGASQYVYEFLWCSMCPRVDFICDIRSVPTLPEKLCYVLAMIEDVTHIPTIVSGPPVCAIAALVAYKIFKDKYNATDPLDLLYKIILDKYGKEVAEEIFKGFTKEIEKLIEVLLKELNTKYAASPQGISPSQAAKFRQEKKQQLIEQMSARLPAQLEGQRGQFERLVAQMKAPASAGLALGEQAAAKKEAKTQLRQLIRNIVEFEVKAVDRLKMKRQEH